MNESHSNDSYIARQLARDAQYKREYSAWVESMPEEKRRELEKAGLDKPSIPGAASGMSDAATSNRARCEAADIEEPDANAEPQDEQTEEPAPGASADGHPHSEERRMHRLVRRLVGELMGQADGKLSMECLSLVTGLTYDGDSMTRIASKYGVTRAAVSKRCVELTQALNLKPSRAMRTRSARQSYRQSRTLHLRTTS